MQTAKYIFVDSSRKYGEMKIFGKWFGKPIIHHSEITEEMLNWPKADMILPDKNFSDEAVEVYFHVPTEEAELLVKDLITILHKIDAMVQSCPNTEFEIGYINIYDDNMKVRYFGLKVNTEFDIEVYKDAEQWYCSRQGGTTYNPPKRI